MEALFEIERKVKRSYFLWLYLALSLCFLVAVGFVVFWYCGMDAGVSLNPFQNIGFLPILVVPCVFVPLYILYQYLLARRGYRFLIYPGRIGIGTPILDMDIGFKDIVSITIEPISLLYRKGYSVAFGLEVPGQRRMRRHLEIALEMRKGARFYLVMPDAEAFYERLSTAKSEWDRTHGAVAREDEDQSKLRRFLYVLASSFIMPFMGHPLYWGPSPVEIKGFFRQKRKRVLVGMTLWLVSILTVLAALVPVRMGTQFERWARAMNQTARGYHRSAIQHELDEQDTGEIWRKAAELHTDMIESHPRLPLGAFMGKAFYASMYHNLGVAYLGSGEAEKATEAFEKAVEMIPRPHRWFAGMVRRVDRGAFYNLLGSAYAQAGQYDRAITTYLQTVERAGPDFAGMDRARAVFAHSGLGMAYGQQEQYDLSVAHYQKVLALDPSYILAYEGLARAYRGKGWADSVAVLEDRARQLDPDGEWTKWLRENLVRQTRAYRAIPITEM